MKCSHEPWSGNYTRVSFGDIHSNKTTTSLMIVAIIVIVIIKCTCVFTGIEK
jgi:hypothetical protein